MFLILGFSCLLDLENQTRCKHQASLVNSFHKSLTRLAVQKIGIGDSVYLANKQIKSTTYKLK
jgi:hypothetical protein